MSLAQVASMLAGFVALFTLAQVAPLVTAMQEDGGPYAAAEGFVASLLIGGVCAIALWLIGRR